MSAKQTTTKRVTVTRIRTPKSTSTSKSHASSKSGQKDVPDVGGICRNGRESQGDKEKS